MARWESLRIADLLYSDGDEAAVAVVGDPEFVDGVAFAEGGGGVADGGGGLVVNFEDDHAFAEGAGVGGAGVYAGDDDAFIGFGDAVFFAEFGGGLGDVYALDEVFSGGGGEAAFEGAEGDGKGEFLVVAPDVELDGLAGGGLGDSEAEGGDVVRHDTVYAEDDVAALEACEVCGFAGLDALDDYAFCALGEAEGFGEVCGKVGYVYAEEAALDGAGANEALCDAGHEVRRDGEADADVSTGGGDDGGIDADEAAHGVHECAAGVSGVYGGICLDKVFVALGAEDAELCAACGADDAHSNRLADAHGVANGEDHIAHEDAVAIGELDVGEAGGLDFEEGDIGAGIAPDDLGAEFALVVEADHDLVCDFAGLVGHDVIIGEDVAVCGYDDAGAEAVGEFALFELPLILLRGLRHAVKAAQQLFKGILGAAAHDAHHACAGDRDDRRAYLCEHGGVAGLEHGAVQRAGIHLETDKGILRFSL